MGIRDLVFGAAVLGGAATLAAGLVRPPRVLQAPEPARPATAEAAAAVAAELRPIVARVDGAFRRHWADGGLLPAPPADDLARNRRISLALTGAVPSLEEIRRFEALPAAGRVAARLDELLHDRRTTDYLAERFARVFVGVEDGPFIVFRRRRFISWLSDAILQDRPYDAIVRDLITESGLWTDHPATNFLSVTRDEKTERPDPERVAARVARAFLGVRLDCAQCHNHPFQTWKQADFRGLAAFFGGLRANLLGVNDGPDKFEPPDRKTRKPTVVEPAVPFRPELLPRVGTPRERLASWVTDPANPGLARVTVNRVWALLLGRPLAEPIDDLPAAGELNPALDLLAQDFASHGYRLHRLIRAIAATEVFGLDSFDGSSSVEYRPEDWASFPLSRLRPEQVASSIFQAGTLTTLDTQSHWFIRLSVFTGRNDFVRRYGDAGEDEFEARGGTIPQRLLLMNGDLVQNKIRPGFFNASAQIALLAPDDRKAIEVAYLATLTRRPTPEESAHFQSRLAQTTGQKRKDRLTDLYWTLLNSTEFSWNH